MTRDECDQRYADLVRIETRRYVIALIAVLVFAGTFGWIVS